MQDRTAVVDATVSEQLGSVAFESPADQAGFTQLPNAVLRDPTISSPAKVAYALLRMYAWQGDGAYPGQEALATLMGVSPRSVRQYLRELEGQMLVRTQRRGSTSNLYVLLALGLRAKRIAEGATGSVLPIDDRKPASDQTGSLLPTKKTQGKKTQQGESAHARELAVKFNGKPVDAERWALTQQILTEFNSQAGKKLRLTSADGSMSEASKRIYGRVVKYRDLTLGDFADIIRRTLASRWWGGGEVTAGVVFGPAVFEDNITRQGIARGTKDSERRERAAKDREAIQRILERTAA
jgi:hypothetical protein